MATATKKSPPMAELPCDLNTWPKVKSLLLELKAAASLDDLVKSLDVIVIGVINHQKPPNKDDMILRKCIFYGLKRFLEKEASGEERERFHRRLLPFIIDTAIRIEDLKPASGIAYSLQKKECTIELKAEFIASVIACAFLCLFPRRPREIASRLNDINFNNFFHYLPSQPQSAKLRCILHYFDRIASARDNQTRSVKFSRQVLSSKESLHIGRILSCDRPLCPVTVHHEGKIEDAGSEILQIDFANSYIGGGVLHAGRVQEEIRFCISPELMAAMLFMQCMDENEAIIIEGFEQFSHYAGYAENLKYFGNFTDSSLRDSNGNIITKLSAIDAIPFMWGGQQKQYEEKNVMREINKAYIGFLQPSARIRRGSKKRPIRNEDSLVSDSSEEYYSAPESLEDEEGSEAGEVRDTNLLPSPQLDDNVLTPPDTVKTCPPVFTTSTINVVSSPPAPTLDPSSQRDKPEGYTEGDKDQGTDDGDSSSSGSFSLDLFELEKLRADVLRRRGSGFSDVSFHSSRRSSSGTRHSSDYSDFDTWAANFRRRSSNLSNLSDLSSGSRRSSSSPRYSSDFSSEFEEYYETFQTSERRKIQHTAILEEVGNPVITEYASNLAASVLKESSAVVNHLEQGVCEFSTRGPLGAVRKPTAVKPTYFAQGPFLPPLTDTRKYHGRDESDIESSDSSGGMDPEVSVTAYSASFAEGQAASARSGPVSPLFPLITSEPESESAESSGKGRAAKKRSGEDAVRQYVGTLFSGLGTSGINDGGAAPPGEAFGFQFYSDAAEGQLGETSRLEAPPNTSLLNLDLSQASSQEGASSSDMSIDNLNISLSQPLSGASMDSSSQSESAFPSHSLGFDASTVGHYVDSFVTSVISSAVEQTSYEHLENLSEASSWLGPEASHNVHSATSVADRMVDQVFSDLRDEFKQSIPDSMKLLQSGSSGPYSPDSTHTPQIIVSHYLSPSLLSYIDRLVSSAFEAALAELSNLMAVPQVDFNPSSPSVSDFVDNFISESFVGAYDDFKSGTISASAMDACGARKHTSNYLSVKTSSSSSNSSWSRSSFSSASTSSGDLTPGSGDRSPIVTDRTILDMSREARVVAARHHRHSTGRRAKSQSFSDYGSGNVMDDIKNASVRRHQSVTGFCDPTLSSFAEELLRLDTSSPSFDIFDHERDRQRSSTSESSLSSPRPASSSESSLFSQLLSSSSSFSSHSGSSSCRPVSPSGPGPSHSDASYRTGGVLRTGRGPKQKVKKKSQSWHPSVYQSGKKTHNKKFTKSVKKKSTALEKFADKMVEQIFDDTYFTIQNLWYEFWPYQPTDSDYSCTGSEKSITFEDRRTRVDHRIVSFADRLADEIMTDVLSADSKPRRIRRWSEMAEYSDAMDVPYMDMEDFASMFVTCVIHESLQIVNGLEAEDSLALSAGLSFFSSNHQRVDYYSKGDVWQTIRPVATGNWGCGAFGGDPQLKAMIQWIAATQAGCPAMIYYTFRNQRVQQLGDVSAMILERGWTVGLLMKHIEDYCKHAILEFEGNGSVMTTLFEYLNQQM